MMYSAFWRDHQLHKNLQSSMYPTLTYLFSNNFHNTKSFLKFIDFPGFSIVEGTSFALTVLTSKFSAAKLLEVAVFTILFSCQYRLMAHRSKHSHKPLGAKGCLISYFKQLLARLICKCENNFLRID